MDSDAGACGIRGGWDSEPAEVHGGSASHALSRVDATDEAILLAKIGTRDLTADFDGDGVVTEADHAILRAHLGHACDMPTPVRATGWGAVKTRYR